jgi:putative ABC transport system substrate-binding protein
VGLLHLQASGSNERVIAGFHQGLKGTGFVDGQNLVIDYRLAHQEGQLPGLAANLVRSRVEVIVTAGGNLPALAAKAATSKLPVVFADGTDPVKVRLVASLSRPGGNVTGVTHLDQANKRVELVNELVPRAAVIGYVFDSRIPGANDAMQQLLLAAFSAGQQIVPVELTSSSDLESEFARLKDQKADVLMVAIGPRIATELAKLTALATRHRIPAIYQRPDFVHQGGLMSYSADLAESWRLAGMYAGRILKGAKPGDLPIVQTAKCELVINLRAAKAIGFTVPRSLRLIADELLE